MIDVQEALARLPHFEKFCSVAKLEDLVRELQTDPGFEIRVAGTTRGGRPIHHAKFGRGSARALVVGFPHCMEPIGGLTVFSLLTLLHQRVGAVSDADVEWHVIPCVDPDGAILNEGWSQFPFTLERLRSNYYVQPVHDQVDGSFPVSHKKLVWKELSLEAEVLKGVIDQVRPDFFFPLHNTRIGGAFHFVSRDLGRACHDELHALLERHGFPIENRPLLSEVCASYAHGVSELLPIRRWYDYLERTAPNPEERMRHGVTSWDYLAEVKPEALTFVAEMGYALHPDASSDEDTGESYRKFLLRLDADAKYLATILLEEWESVRAGPDADSPFFRTVAAADGGVLPPKDRLVEGGQPLTLYPTRDALFNPRYAGTMTRADRFNACFVSGGFSYLTYSYQFVRLLKASPQTEAIRRSTRRLEGAFDDAYRELAGHIDLGALQVNDCDTLARIQLGSGLVALNALLLR